MSASMFDLFRDPEGPITLAEHEAQERWLRDFRVRQAEEQRRRQPHLDAKRDVEELEELLRRARRRLEATPDPISTMFD